MCVSTCSVSARRCSVCVCKCACVCVCVCVYVCVCMCVSTGCVCMCVSTGHQGKMYQQSLGYCVCLCVCICVCVNRALGGGISIMSRIYEHYTPTPKLHELEVDIDERDADLCEVCPFFLSVCLSYLYLPLFLSVCLSYLFLSYICLSIFVFHLCLSCI